MTTAIQTIEKVRSTANTRKRDNVRVAGALADYDFARQGDLYIFKLPGVPANAKRAKKPEAQVAPGTTQGSRHIIADVGSVKVYELPNANALQGPVIDAPNGMTLEHPEHGHQRFMPGVYLVTFQRAFADTLRRVAD